MYMKGQKLILLRIVEVIAMLAKSMSLAYPV